MIIEKVWHMDRNASTKSGLEYLSILMQLDVRIAMCHKQFKVNPPRITEGTN